MLAETESKHCLTKIPEKQISLIENNLYTNDKCTQDTIRIC